MLKRIITTFCAAGLLLNLTGCASWWQQHNFVKKRRTEYLRSHATAPLRVPANLDKSAIGDDYVVPADMTLAPKQPIGIFPPDSMKDKLARGVMTKQDLKAAAKLADAKPAMAPANTAAANTNKISPNITTAANNNFLALHKPIDQVWDAVGAAIKRAGYHIALQDKQLASYYILDTYATDQVITKATPMYQLKLQAADDGNAYAYITDEKGNLVDTIISQPILSRLSDALAGKSPSSFSRMFAPVTRWLKEAF